MPLLTSEERIGTLLADKYRIERIIGKGGMGVVFGAEHTWTGRRVAVKIIHPTLAEDELIAQRLLREARTAASLNHPNAVQVLDMGADADGTVFLVLELLEGESLDARLKRQKQLSFPETLAILLPVMNALAVAHELGLVHRDLKPDNIFLHEGPTGVVPTLLDFGLAKVVQEGGGAKVTQTGVVMGTPHYIAPEQAVGESTVGPPADVWAMGVLLFECLAGRMPFEGDSSTKIVMKVVCEKAPKLAELGMEPMVAAHAIDRALEKDLSIRYANMREFAEALWSAATQAGYTSVPGVMTASGGRSNAPIATPSSGSAAVPLYTVPIYTVADGAAPVLMMTPSRGVRGTTPMNIGPPAMTQASQEGRASTRWTAMIGGVLVALFLVGAVSAVAVLILFRPGGAIDDAAPVPTTSAPSTATLPANPARPIVTAPEPEAPAQPAEAEPTEAEPTEVEPPPTEAQAQVGEAPAVPEPAEAAEPGSGGTRRSERTTRRRGRAEVSSSW